MNENLEYIDDYFNKQLAPEENKRFQQRIINDPAFAEEVAFYCNSIGAAAEQSAEDKKKFFREIYNNDPSLRKDQPPAIKRLIPYLAAAAIIAGIVLGWFLLAKPESPQKIADQYINTHLQSLPVSMGNKEDTLQKGLRLYNDGKLKEALVQFENIILSDSSNWQAKKYAGIVSLRIQLYDKAIAYFLKLENNKQLFANPGKFFHALTLLKRNRPGDTDEARKLLQDVVQNNLDEKDAAQELLKQL